MCGHYAIVKVANVKRHRHLGCCGYENAGKQCDACCSLQPACASAGRPGNVAIMLRGQIVECAAGADIFAPPRDAYTRALLEAVPRLGRRIAAPLL
jgi:hypothetical protein